ncbi:MAG: PEP-CTERM sorting domain-containing protein [Fimbriimonadaceae bacterium]|nr:PEP-CTERM sorting domain-containing protein [Fimbriimonadaceae bacterium]
MIAAAAASGAHAITFFNVNVSGSLAPGNTVNIFPDNIDFLWSPPASVGDPVAPVRFGNIIITYEATNATPMNQMVLSLLGALSGKGTIIVNEVIEDAGPGGGTLASGGATLTAGNWLPPSYTQTFNFSRAVTHVKVKKTFTLIAEDSTDPQILDLASISLIQQKINVVPEPGTMAALGLGAVALITRRRKKK